MTLAFLNHLCLRSLIEIRSFLTVLGDPLAGDPGGESSAYVMWSCLLPSKSKDTGWEMINSSQELMLAGRNASFLYKACSKFTLK